MPTFDDFRNRFPSLKDASDEEIIKRASEVFKLPITDVAHELGYDVSGGLTSQRTGASFDRYQAGLYGVGEAAAEGLGLGGASKWMGAQRRRNEAQADISSERARELGAVDEWKDVHGVGDFGNYLAGLGIQSAPYALEAIPGGLGARAAMTGTRAALAGAKTLEEAAAAKRALNIGSQAGAVAASYPSAVGDVLSNQREQSGETRGGVAAALAVPYAALNAVGIESALARGAAFKNTVNILDRGTGLTGAAARTAATATGVALKEGASETGQEMLNQVGRMSVDSNEDFLSAAAQDRFKESFIGGATLGGVAGAAGGGWRRSSAGGNEISQSMGDKAAIQPDITTQQFQQTSVDPRARLAELEAKNQGTPAREHITEDGEIIRIPGKDREYFTAGEQAEYAALKQQFAPAAPAVAGGSTEIAQAQQLAKQQADQQQAQAQQAQAAAQAAEQFGVTNPATPSVGSAFGQKVYGPNIDAVSHAIANFTSRMPPQQVQLAQAITKANAETGGQLIKFQFNANDVMASVDKGFQAVGKVANQFQIAHVESVDEAAAILNDQSEQVKGDKLDQLNAIFQALTGQNTNGYEAAQLAQLAKGAKDDKLQLQNNAGLREVPVSGGATETSASGDGGVRPTQVQPVGTTSVGAGPLDIQAGQPSTGGVRPSAGDVSSAVSASTPSPQVSEVTDGQATTEGGQTAVQPTGQAEAVPSVQQAGKPARAAEEVKSDEELLADQAEDITAEVMELLIPVHQRMAGKTPQERAETAQRLRDFTFGILMNGHYDTLAVMANDFGIKLHQAKDWSAKALAFKAEPEFLQKLKAAYETAASKRGLTIPELLTRIEAKANAAINDKVEVDRSISTSREQGGPRDSDERKLNLGFDAEGRDTGEIEANEGLAIKSRKSGESIQERFNAVETNQASVTKILKMLDEIENAQTNTQEFSEARVAGALAKYEAALVNGTPVPQDSLFVLAYDAMQKGNEGEATMYVEELEAIRDEKLAKAAEQAKKQTNKSADLDKPEKESKNAVQKPSPKKVPVQERTGGGEALGEGDTEGGKVARESGEEKTQHRITFEGKAATLTVVRNKATPEKVEAVTVKPDGERFAVLNLGAQGVVSDAKLMQNLVDTESIDATTEPKQEEVGTPAEQWAVLAAQFPAMGTYEELGQEEKARWDDLAHRGVANLAAANKLFEAPAAQVTDESNIIDGEGLVREITPEQIALLEAPVGKLTEGQTVRLEKHYGAKRGSSEFFTKLHNDISLYAAKGATAVNAAIRDIIKAVYTAVLAVAVVFNPTYMNKAEAYTFSPAEEYSVTKEVRAEAPAEAASKMSPAAKEAYATLMPALKAELTAKDKLLVMADKPSGRIFVFTPDGKLVIEKKSLFGLAKGDFYKGNNDLPSNRITPAGLHDIVMVDAAKGGAAAKTAGDYDFGKVFGIVDKNPGVLTIMHSVWLKETDAPKRAAALKSETAADSRYSFGCINVDKVTYKNLIDNHGQQMDGAKLFVVPDNQERLNDFVTGKVAQNLTNEDKLVRQAVTPVTETTTGVRQNATQAAAAERTVVGKEEQAPANAPAQQAKTVQQSLRRRNKGKKYTPEQLKASLLDFMNRASLGKDVVIVDDIRDLHDLAEFAEMDGTQFDTFLAEQEIDYDTQAFVYKGKAYMLAGNIAVGTGRGVFMHEVGGHLGIQKALSPEMVSRLADQVKKWAKRDDGSIESDLAAHAIGRMLDSNAASPAERQQEMIAYFLEAAVNAGINPTAYNKIGSAGLREWMRTLWAAFKNALRMVRGVNVDKMTGQDLIDLAYGYAQLSATRFHGSNAKFQRFLTKFMNSGAGGQQYGWGTYFAEARPTAEGYSVPDIQAPAGTRSHVYTVDLAIAPDEMILWSKPMEAQSPLVQAAAAKHPAKSMYTGMDFYKGTSERLYEEKYGVEPTTKAQRSEAEKMASQFMDSLGIKGIQYLDATTAARDTSNFVVFNEDNIIRVQTETGLAQDRQAMVPEFKWERVQQSRTAQPAGPFAKAGEWLDRAVTSPKETLTKLKLGFLTLDQLAELDKTAGQVVRAYSDVMTAMQKTSKDMVYKASQIDQLWAKLTKKDSDNLSTVMRDATRAQFDPALGVVGKNQTEQDIMDAYRALPSSAKDVYAKVKKYYEDAFKTRLAIMEESAAKLGGKELDEIRELYSKLKGPYFPLGRTGNYYAVGMSPRVAELMAKKEDQGLSSSETTELTALRKQADQYKTSSFNTLYEAKKAAEQFKKELGDSYYNETEVNIESAMSKTPNFAKLEESITAQLGGETRAEVKNMLAKLMFDSLPEHHALKNQMRREGIYGENEDMRQVFAQTSISQAHYISRLQFGGELNNAMLSIAKEARRDIEMRQIQNELKLRTKLSMDNTQSALTDAMVNASYFAHLGLSPAFLLTNMTQVPMITAPWLGARHGMGATKRAMAAALVDTAKLIKSTYKDGDWRSELDWNSMFPVGSNEDRMFRDLLDRNVLDITMEHDLAAVASAQKGIFDDKISKATGGKLGGMSDVVKLVNTPVRITELANRAVTALSAYRLKMQALASAPMTDEERHKASVDYAARAVSETQLNYSELNAPRHMRQVFGSKPLAKMIFQFRKYQQGMLYLIAKNISDALPGSKATAEDRRIARRTIAGLYMTTGLMAGTTGMPLMGTVGVAGIANLIANAFGDDDEPWDFEVEYRNFLADWLGHDMALLVAKGVPAALGADLSKRVGMGDIANPIPFVQRGATGQSTVANVLYAAGGAPIGMAGTMYDGIVAMANGDVLKGMEKVIPVKAVKDALRTYRYADEGMTDKRGNVILAPEKFDTWDLALRGMGFSPTKETEYYAANAALQTAKMAATDVRTRLLRDYSEAKLKGESTADVDAKIAEFNERHPEKGIKIDFSTKLKSVQARRKMAAERTESGVRIGKYEKPFASEARFASEE